MKLIVLSGEKNLPGTNARRELIIELMGVDLFPTRSGTSKKAN